MARLDLGNVVGKSAYEAAKDGGYTGTEEEFNTMIAEGGGGIKTILVWENADITSDFAAQSLTVPGLAELEHGDVIVIPTVNEGVIAGMYYNDSDTVNVNYSRSGYYSGGKTMEGSERKIDINGTTVTVYDGHSFSAQGYYTTANYVAVPAKIFIVKFSTVKGVS